MKKVFILRGLSFELRTGDFSHLMSSELGS